MCSKPLVSADFCLHPYAHHTHSPSVRCTHPHGHPHIFFQKKNQNFFFQNIFFQPKNWKKYAKKRKNGHASATWKWYPHPPAHTFLKILPHYLTKNWRTHMCARAHSRRHTKGLVCSERGYLRLFYCKNPSQYLHQADTKFVSKKEMVEKLSWFLLNIWSKYSQKSQLWRILG